MPFVQHFKDLRVYQLSFEAAMRIFEVSKHWPKHEQYALTDQIRRSSRSVSANIAEAWRKRRYVSSFISKLSDADAEVAETQVWLEFALKCGYIEEALFAELHSQYDQIAGGLVKMMADPTPWCGPATLREEPAPYTTDLTNDSDWVET
jgi:four helix bundle protein